MKPENYDTEEKLQRLFLQDPEQAIEVLFRQHYTGICRSVLRIIPDHNVAEDLAQEVFFELWRKRVRLRINTSFGAYLRRAARNKALNYIRDNRIISDGEDRLPQMPVHAVSVHQQLDADDLQLQIDEAIARLPDRCRIIFTLSRYEDLTYQEIADHLGISIKTVENQISKALRQLRTSLQAYLPTFVALLTFISLLYLGGNT